MLAFIIRRLISALAVVVLTSMFIFALFFLGPSNPAADLCAKQGHCTPAKEAAISHNMGLDVPVLKAYWEFVKGLVHTRTIFYGWDIKCPAPCLGVSWSSHQPITHELLTKYPPTIFIALGGALFFLIIGIGTGLLAARYRGGWIDRSLMSTSLVLWAIPFYILLLLAWIIFTQKFHIFPSSGNELTSHSSPLKWIWALMLPWLCIGVAYAGTYSRYSRSQLVETLGEDYIRTGKAKGVSGRKLLFKHALRAAVVPIVTMFGMDLAFLLAGTFYVENIFGFDGVGAWSLKAVQSPIDFPVITATVLLTAVLIVVGNLVVDVIYGFLDPRVQVGTEAPA